jgi:glycosyltransferase involved in cell wall biosynthesis
MTPVRVSHLVWRLSATGGIPRVVRDLLQASDPAMVDTRVVSIRPALAEDRLDEVIEPGRLFPLGHPLGGSRAGLVARLPALTRRVRSSDPQILHLHSGTSWTGLPAALSLRDAARLLDVHDEPQSGRSRGLNVASMRMMATRLGFRVITHSSVVRRRTAESFGLDEADIGLIPLGVDTHRFRPDTGRGAEFRAQLGLAHDRPIVVWVGRVDSLKRPDDAVAVARLVERSHPGALLLLAGAGPLVEPIRAASRDGAPVMVLGGVDDLVGLLNAADVYLSTSGYEGFGLSVAEAMSCGLPVVSTRAGGVVDLVAEGRTGHLLDVGDVEGLADRVCSLLADGDRRRELGSAGRSAATARFDRRQMAAAYADEYRRLAGASR